MCSSDLRPRWLATTLAAYQMWSSGTMVGGVLAMAPGVNYVGAGPMSVEVFRHFLRYPGPKAIMGISASIAYLARFAEGLEEEARRSFRIAMYGSGQLTRKAREDLRAGYPEIVVLSYFAATQAEAIGLQLDPGSEALATVPGLHLVEIVGPDGRAVAEGEEGELVVTRLLGDQAPLLAALAAVGVQPTDVEIAFPDDPSLPFDPYALFDGTFTATAVTRYDGAARLQEFYDLETGLPVGPEGTVEVVDDGGIVASAPGIGIWARRTALEDEDYRIAMALTLIAIADGLASCRDDAAGCAVVMEESGIVDRYGDGLLWSVNAFNATLWPAPDGALSIDEERLSAAVSQAVSVGLVGSAPSSADLVDRRVLELALAHLPAEIDLIGASWAPLEVQLPLE